jgi:hypothetical protein
MKNAKLRYPAVYGCEALKKNYKGYDPLMFLRFGCLKIQPGLKKSPKRSCAPVLERAAR